MEWSPGDRSNIEDRRGAVGGRAIPVGLGGLAVLLVISWLTGINFFSLLTDQSGGPPASPTSQVAGTPQEERAVDFVDVVANDTQDVWAQALGGRYQRTKVVLFRDATQSACGFAESATGPFYCPNDEKVYLDLGFFDELSRRFGAPGDFAKAYVIAHEFGHHVQHLTGLDSSVRGGATMGAGGASVALELQADCFAGVWGYAASRTGSPTAGHVRVSAEDVPEALRAAAAIGDDRIQRETTGRVMPERFTHGTSAQRVEAFRRGMSSGDPNACRLTADAR
jgi:predicted metalloprotease